MFRSKIAQSNFSHSEWTQKGTTLSDKTAIKEFGLSRQTIMQGIQSGKLQFRQNSVYGSPFFRLLRSEVESLVKKKCGDDYLESQKKKTELKQISRQIKQLKVQLIALEERKSLLSN